MKTRIKILVFIGLMMLTTIGYSQTGTVKIITNPSKAIIRLDTTLLKSNVPVQVKPGDYTLKMWSPKRRFYEQKLTVKSDSNIRLMKTLTFEDDYIKYENDRKRYRMKRFSARVFPITIFTGITLFNLKRVNRLSNELDLRSDRIIAAQTYYDNSIHFVGIDNARNSFNSEKAAYDSELTTLNHANIITYGTIAIGAIVSWYFIKVSNKLKEPTYEPKTLLSNLNFNYQENKGINSFILTYNF
jgi:hypothetical protein